MPRRSRRRKSRRGLRFLQNGPMVFFLGAAVGILGLWLSVKLLNSPLIASILGERGPFRTSSTQPYRTDSTNVTRVLPSDLNPETSHGGMPLPVIPPKPISGVKRESAVRVLEIGGKPKIAIVIDDIGYHDRLEKILFSTGIPLTLAILPQLNYSMHFSREGKKRGYLIILHQPMEPEVTVPDPDPGMITMRMNKDQVKKTLSQDLESVPDAEGINNHMGSKVTQNANIMHWVLEELKKRKLFFLDSMTSENSVGWVTATDMDVPNLKRSVFLDNENDPAYVEKQIWQTVELSRKHGYAVAIGHYRQVTLDTIKKLAPQIKKQGIEAVNLKELLRQ